MSKKKKMTCPACASRKSSIRAAFMDGDPCPICGLEADAARQIDAIRKLAARKSAATESVQRMERTSSRTLQVFIPEPASYDEAIDMASLALEAQGLESDAVTRVEIVRGEASHFTNGVETKAWGFHVYFDVPEEEL